jgi:hypothetical protein
MRSYDPSRNTAPDPLVHSNDKPDILSLTDELQRCFFHGTNAAELVANDDLRFCRWEGQTVDGKKRDNKRREGMPTAPFDGASDVRIRLIDRVINEQVAMLMNAWKSSKVGVNGRGTDDAQVAAGMDTLLKHICNSRMKSELRNEVELWAQYGNQYGWSAMHVGWEQQVGTREHVMKVEDIVMMAQQVASGEDVDNDMLSLPQYIMNPETSDIAETILAQRLTNVTAKDIKRMVRELRNRGETKYFEQTITKNLPSVTALKPWDEIGFPPETIEFQNARVVFRRVFMNEVELRSLVLSDDWDESSVDIALRTAGQQSWYNDPNVVPRANLINNELYRGKHLVEVVYAFARQIDSNGVPQIWQTAFCPNAGDKNYFKHERLGYAHGKYPFVIYRRENIRKNIAESRGITEILMTEQAELKGQHDSMRDRTSFETMPPFIMRRRIGGVGRIGPAQQIGVSSPDDIKFLEPPRGTPNLAEMVIQQVETNAAKYFGLSSALTEKQPTQHAMMIQQMAVDNFLTQLTEVYTHIMQLSLQYMENEEIERVVTFALPDNILDISNQFDFEMKFDVRNQYVDFVMEKLSAISQFVLPLDSGGIIDRNKLVLKALEAIAPESAADLVSDQTSASQKMFKDVQTEIGMMMLGNEPQYVENDPTAKSKMQFAQQVIQKNPKAQQAMQGDQVFQALFQNYVKNLQMSISQQQNKVVGRIGVTPVSDKLNEEAQGEGV